MTTVSMETGQDRS